MPLKQKKGGELIKYRTSAHNLEDGKSSEWEGIEGKPTMEWMLYHVVRHAQGQFRKVKIPENSSVIELPIRLRLKNVTIRDAEDHMATCARGEYFSGFVSHETSLEISAGIQVTGAYDTRRIGYFRTDVFAIRLADGKRLTLGSAVPENQGKRTGMLRVTLKDIALEAGVYVIRVVTLLNHHKPALDYLEASLLVVI
jgi:hypothetical protein